MKKYALPGIAILLVVLLGAVIFKAGVLKKPNAGLQVNSIPQATVFLDSKEVGKTPFENTQLSSGEKVLKLVPLSSGSNLNPWESKIKLVNGAVSLVNWEFGADESTSTGEVIVLDPASDKKNASLVVISRPDSCLVKLDGESKGFTPVSLEKLSPGEHEITLSSPDYKERKIRTKFFGGFKTTINARLAQISPAGGSETIATPSATITPTLGKTTPTPSPRPKVTQAVPQKPYVKVLDTPTGWLRVRSSPSTSASELAKVYPGEMYALLEEKSGWYKIPYEQNKEGWVSSQYAQKFE